jgi:hypothetical protein
MFRRNTPIGALHRLIWLYIPHGFRSADQRLTNGRLSASILRLAHTLWNDRHPVVMVRKHMSHFAVPFVVIFHLAGRAASVCNLEASLSARVLNQRLLGF